MDASASVMDQYMTSVYQLSFQCFSDRQTHGRTDLRTSPLRRTHLKIVKPRQKHIFKHKQHSHRKCTDPVSRYCLPAACSYLSLAYRELRSQHENFFLPLHCFFCCCLSLALPLFVSFLLLIAETQGQLSLFLDASSHLYKRVFPSVFLYVRYHFWKTSKKRSKQPKNIAVVYKTTPDASICSPGLVSFILCRVHATL